LVNNLLRTRVESGAKSLADFFDSNLQLISLEENQENSFPDFAASEQRIKDRFVDFGSAQKYVSSASPPQHLLKGGHAFSRNDAGHKSKMHAAHCGAQSGFFNRHLVLDSINVDFDLVLLLEKLLSLLQGVLQFRQFKEILLQSFGVLIDLEENEMPPKFSLSKIYNRTVSSTGTLVSIYALFIEQEPNSVSSQWPRKQWPKQWQGLNP